MKRLLSTGLAVTIGALLLAGCAGPQPAATGGPAPTPGINARGVGTAKGAPDIVTVDLGVSTRAPSAQAALGANNERAAALIATLKNSGVAEADIRTSQLSVNPTYADGGRINGYEVNNSVTATLRDIAAAGRLIDAAGEAAGDAVRVNSLQFSIDDDSALRTQARADAVRQAQAQAKQMAEAAGVRTGVILSINEVVTPTPGPYWEVNAGAADQKAAVPLQPGTQELTVTVDVVYAIDQ
ncbi:SIMPL domain-containing protein [Pseudonocardia sp. TRM90224]|uniref:SIMPL domain-containing protein n=1 Tax=Pseudonocardia sp. TRM90224 TaxID=2812678 RepID=UPI001E3A8637|nr:SIMPL domain-containing protein [Pseudonocardia sp. TRM90224]